MIHPCEKLQAKIVKKSNFFLLPLIIFPVFTWSGTAFAHSTKIEYQQTRAIEIEATYHDGTPMKNAQVVIYAPNDPATPWIKGMTDDRGRYIFIPDYSQTGNWDVKVRQSGHGGIITIPVAASSNGDSNSEITFDRDRILSPTAEYTSMQKLVMAAVGVWGFVGTALFFSKRKVQQQQ